MIYPIGRNKNSPITQIIISPVKKITQWQLCYMMEMSLSITTFSYTLSTWQMAAKMWENINFDGHSPQKEVCYPDILHQIHHSFITCSLLSLFGHSLCYHLLTPTFCVTNASPTVSQLRNLRVVSRQLNLTWCGVREVTEAFRLQWERLALCLMSLERTQSLVSFIPGAASASS